MRPECALPGTVAIRPDGAECRCEAGEKLEVRAPGELGKATVIPAFKPGPVSNRVPRVETTCGLVLQWAEGTQLA
jgi:hypothetical protein